MRVDYASRETRYHEQKFSRAFPRCGAIVQLDADRIGEILSAGLHHAEACELSFDLGETLENAIKPLLLPTTIRVRWNTHAR
jgi:hypothetical protein